MSEKDVRQSCPYCRGNCNCKACFCVDDSSASFHDKVGLGLRFPQFLFTQLSVSL